MIFEKKLFFCIITEKNHFKNRWVLSDFFQNNIQGGALMLEERNAAVDNNTSKIPKYVYESLARSLLAVIQKYFEAEEDKKAFAKWQAKQAKNNLK